MFDLTADQEQRAVRLHRESLVVDSLSPGPIGCSPEMERCYAERLSRGMPFLAARTEVQRHIETLLLGGRYPAWRDAWYDSGVDAGSCTVGVFGPYGNWTYQQAVHDLALWQRRFDTLDWLEKVRTPADVERIGAQGRKGVILNFQNARAIEDRLDYLDFFYDLGVRVVQLTYNSRNLLGDGCTELSLQHPDHPRRNRHLTTAGVGDALGLPRRSRPRPRQDRRGARSDCGPRRLLRRLHGAFLPDRRWPPVDP